MYFIIIVDFVTRCEIWCSVTWGCEHLGKSDCQDAGLATWFGPGTGQPERLEVAKAGPVGQQQEGQAPAGDLLLSPDDALHKTVLWRLLDAMHSELPGTVLVQYPEVLFPITNRTACVCQGSGSFVPDNDLF